MWTNISSGNHFFMPNVIDIVGTEALAALEHDPRKFRLADADPVEHIRLRPGTWPHQLLIENRSGTAAQNLVIEPLHPGWIDADQRPDPRASRHDFILLQLKNCKHVTIRGLSLANAWPTAILLSGCTDIIIEDCRFRGATEAIYAKGSAGIIVRRCHWQQDTSPGHDLWHTIDWVESHGEEGGNNTFAYYNGAFFGAKSVRDVKIEANTISDAYNGIRIKAVGDHPTSPNVDIVGNTFVRIRDNPIEPEYHAWNWHIRHNEIIDAHAWFSFDGVEGGHIYLYGNRGRFRSRPGERTSLHHTMGRLLKLSYLSTNPQNAYGAKSPQHPWYIFNNSFRLRAPLIGGAAESIAKPDLFGIGPDVSSHLTFANNVFEWCGPDEFDDYVCSWIELIRNFQQRDGDAVIFDGSLCNRPDYLADARTNYGWEQNGRLAAAPLFRDGPGGDLRLAEASPGLDSAIALTIETEDGPHKVRPGETGTHRGAWQSYGLTELCPADEATAPTA